MDEFLFYVIFTTADGVAVNKLFTSPGAIEGSVRAGQSYVDVSETVWALPVNEIIVIDDIVQRKAAFANPNKTSATANGTDAIRFTGLPDGTLVTVSSNVIEIPYAVVTVTDGTFDLTSTRRATVTVTLEHAFRLRKEVSLGFA